MTELIVWSATIALILGLMVFDFIVVVRNPHEPSFKESLRWTGFYIGLAIVFGVSMVFWRGSGPATEFFTGYVTEWSLSVDNLFIFLIIMSKFAVPPEYRQRVLLFGVAVALVLRGLFILAGAAALAQWSWMFFIFGGILIYTAVSVAREGAGAEDEDYKENAAMRLLRRVLPATEDFRGPAMWVRENGKVLVTPLLLVMFAVGTTDVVFALDSIPAIFGITQDPYLVFVANAFALMGLRQLFFVVQGLLDRLLYLSHGLAIVLGFIGIKLVMEALHKNELPFINGGEHLEGLPIPSTIQSLAFILGVLGISAVISILVSRRRSAQELAEAAAPGQ